MTKLDIAKEIIAKYADKARFGIFNTRNTVKDKMTVIYSTPSFKVMLCEKHKYFEVFGLSEEDFIKLRHFYYMVLKSLPDEELKGE